VGEIWSKDGGAYASAAFKQFREQGASVNPEPTGRAIQQMSLDIKAASDVSLFFFDPDIYFTTWWNSII